MQLHLQTLFFDANPDRLILSLSSGSFSIYESGSFKSFGVVPQGVWSRVVVTISGTTAKCFLNGVQLGSNITISNIDLSSATEVKIGAKYDSSPTSVAAAFNGQLSDFQIWNAVWSATDVANDYAKPNEVVSSVPTVNLVGYWAMTEGDGKIAYDSSSLLSAEKVSNGTFELGSEDVSNGDFELGSEKVTNGDFANGTTGWTVGNGWNVTNNRLNIDTDDGNESFIQLSILEVGKTYVLTLDVSLDVGSIKFTSNEGANFIITTSDTTISYTFVSDSTAIIFRRNVSPTRGYIDNISVKEVTDWVVQQPSGQVVNVANNQVSINYNSSLTQGSTGIAQTVFTNGKTYQTTIDVASVTGTFKVQAGNVNHTITSAGIKTFTNTVSDTALFVVRASNSVSFEATINSISVKEVFPNWTIAGTDATHFVESASGGGARYFSGTTSPVVLTLRQDALTSGKTFQVSCNVAYTGSGKVRCSIGGVNLPPFEEGANTRTATASSAIFQFLRNDINVDAVITNLSILEVTPADNGAIIDGPSWLLAQSTIPQLGMMDWSKGSNLITYSEDFTEWSGGSNTLVSGFISPLGDASAYKISGTSSTILSTSVDLTGRTRSVYARTVSGTGTANLMTYYGNGDVFNLTETWQRFEVTGWSATGASSFYLTDFRGTGSLSEFLVWGAQEVVGTSAGNYRKTNGESVANAILPPYPVNPTTDVLGNLLRQRLDSLNLTGTGYAEVADSPSINPTSAITVQCWIFSNTEDSKGLVAKWIQYNLDYMLFKTTNNFRFYIGNQPLTSGPIPTTGWVNIAGTYDGSNIKTFINGALSTTTAHTGAIPNSTNNLEIGRYFENNGNIYSERIGDVLLYCKALSEEEIKNNYLLGLPAHPNLVKSTADAFKLRVLADGGVFESYTCLETQLTTLNNIS